jgi:hypothetical protein
VNRLEYEIQAQLEWRKRRREAVEREAYARAEARKREAETLKAGAAAFHL